MIINKPEVLAPAGDMERLQAALLFGADAVYLGGKTMGMRAAPKNFDMDELRFACDLAHKQGARVYFTCNSLPTNEEADTLEEYLKQAAQAGVDAFIVADIGVLMAAKRAVPQVDIHISTQAGVTNYLSARELYSLGASRVVLARELSLDTIRTIRDKTPPELEIEAFVHGAMCVSFSGRCLLSQYIVGRDANRGECAQPCRWGYHLMEEKRPGEYYPIYEDERGTYILNAKDMSMIQHIDKLVGAGINSLKIEGRAKSAYYVAVIANAYRNAVDVYMKDPENFQCPEWIIEETKKVSHRQYTPGFYFGRPDDGQYYQTGGYVRTWDIVAVVGGWKDGRLFCSQRNKFYEGDMLEALIPRGGCISLKAVDLRSSEGEKIDCTPHPTMEFSIEYPQPLPAGTIIRKQQN